MCILFYLQNYSTSCSLDYHQESLQLLLNDYFSEFVAIQFKVFFSMSTAAKIWKEYRRENYSKIILFFTFAKHPKYMSDLF